MAVVAQGEQEVSFYDELSLYFKLWTTFLVLLGAAAFYLTRPQLR